MTTSFFSFGLIVLLGAMSPGPDFAIVTKNTLLHSRRSGILTALGISAAVIIHMIYCVLGLAVIIANSFIFLNVIKYAGASYLIYLGLSSFLTKMPQSHLLFLQPATKSVIPDYISFRQGFLCNLLNPEVTLFYLSLFTVTINPNTRLITEVINILEILFITVCWYCTLSVMLSHIYVKNLLEKIEKYMAKALGIFLVAFGVALAFVKI